MRKGVCFSACAYAFLGGKNREVAHTKGMLGHPESQIGFHQFYSTLNKAERLIELLESDTFFSKDQLVSAVILQYLTEINVDPNILTLSALAGPEGMYIPNKDEIKSYGIDYVPDGTFSNIEMEPYNSGLVSFLKPKYNDQTNDLKQITFFCRKNKNLSILLTFGSPRFDAQPSGGVQLNFDAGRNYYTGAFKSIYVPMSAVDVSLNDQRSYWQFSMSQKALGLLWSSKEVALNIDLANAMGFNYAYFEMSQQFKSILELTSRNCI
jgi:hypothetical protein